MGTNMYGFVEVDHADSGPSFSQTETIYSLTSGSFEFGGGGYDAFDALAGGREAEMRPEDRDPNRIPLIAPRGMPNPRSAAVAWTYFYLVTSPSDLPNRYFWPQHRCVSPEVAEEWVQSKGSDQSTAVQWFNVPIKHLKKDQLPPDELTWPVVSEPGFHTASWLRLDEFDFALRHHNLDLAELPVEFAIVRSAMSLVVERRGTDRVRLVVWFG